MFGLVHLVDRFDEASLVRGLVTAAPSMRTRAPEWLHALLCRSLNDRPTCAELERTLRREPEVCAPVRELIEDIAHQPTPLGERARRLLLTA